MTVVLVGNSFGERWGTFFGTYKHLCSIKLFPFASYVTHYKDTETDRPEVVSIRVTAAAWPMLVYWLDRSWNMNVVL